ncbi:MAG: hypothetical protein ACI3VZ_06115 [Faecousia sp.]
METIWKIDHCAGSTIPWRDGAASAVERTTSAPSGRKLFYPENRFRMPDGSAILLDYGPVFNAGNGVPRPFCLPGQRKKLGKRGKRDKKRRLLSVNFL